MSGRGPRSKCSVFVPAPTYSTLNGHCLQLRGTDNACTPPQPQYIYLTPSSILSLCHHGPVIQGSPPIPMALARSLITCKSPSWLRPLPILFDLHSPCSSWPSPPGNGPWFARPSRCGYLAVVARHEVHKRKQLLMGLLTTHHFVIF